MPEKPPIVLTIAGFDPSSGAGITADIKTIAAHGCYGVACITALTVQSTAGVKRVEAVDPSADYPRPLTSWPPIWTLPRSISACWVRGKWSKQSRIF